MKERFFVFSLGEAYRKNISLYIEECWGTIYNELAYYNDRELATVDGRKVGIRGFDEDFINDSITVFRLNTDNPYFLNEKIKYLTQLWKKMLHPKILPYVLVRDMGDYFSEQLLNYATAERAVDGNAPKINKDNYYVFENLFSFYIAQLIFLLMDRIIAMEKYDLGSPLVNLNLKYDHCHDDMLYGTNCNYIIHTPRYLLYKGLEKVKYDKFVQGMSQRDKDYMSDTMNKFNRVIHIPFVSRDIDLPFDKPYISGDYRMHATQPVYIELNNFVCFQKEQTGEASEDESDTSSESSESEEVSEEWSEPPDTSDDDYVIVPH